MDFRTRRSPDGEPTSISFTGADGVQHELRTGRDGRITPTDAAEEAVLTGLGFAIVEAETGRKRGKRTTTAAAADEGGEG